MIDAILDWASAPMTPWWVLALVTAVFAAEAVRVSRRALWGDFFEDDIEDDY